MLRQFINRPIGILMAFLTLVVFGLICFANIPISLLPEVDTPRIIVDLKKQGFSPLEWEENVVENLRVQLRTTRNLKDLESRSSQGNARIFLDFEQGVNMDLAFLDINEKIDRFYMGNPILEERPLVIRQNSSDIPLLGLQIVPKQGEDIVEASKLVKNIIKRRIEQLEGVSLVDLNGFATEAIFIKPKPYELTRLGVTEIDIIRSLQSGNRKLGSINVTKGHYQYQLELDGRINDSNELKKTPIQITHQKYIPLAEIAEITLGKNISQSMHLFNGNGGMVLNIHKTDKARMTELIILLENEIEDLTYDYPQFTFTITRDQSKWLLSSMENLGTSLIYGGVFAIVAMLVFMGSWKNGMIIGLSIPISVIISFIFFYLFDLSLNIISLAGLALGIGMLIDNSIIVIDNIQIKLAEGKSKSEAAYKGTSEVMSALVSSALTTLAVFVPLLFSGGTAGVLFFDNALSIAIILFVSLLVAFILVPVLSKSIGGNAILKSSYVYRKSEGFYKGHFDYLYSRKGVMFVAAGTLLILGVWLGFRMPLNGLPDIDRNEWKARISWPEQITLKENKRRVNELVSSVSSYYNTFEADIGNTQYLLAKDEQDQDNVLFIFELHEDQSPVKLFKRLDNLITDLYPGSIIDWSPAPNPFDYLFSEDDPGFEIRFRPMQEGKILSQDFPKEFAKDNPEMDFSNTIGFQYKKELFIGLVEGKANEFQISDNDVREQIQLIWGNEPITYITDPGHKVPVLLQSIDSSGFMAALDKRLIKSENGTFYPLSELINREDIYGVKEISADLYGPYQALQFEYPLDEIQMEKVKSWALENGLKADFAGQWFKDREQIATLIKILLVSFMLLYLILCAQFESFVQPLIILITVPLGLIGSLMALYLAGSEINLMSGIGMVIVSGIMVNDSILKVDTYNRKIRQEGNRKSIDKIIREVGKMRLKPILMTSITTILAILPILFSSGLGAELQFSMVLSIIGGLVMGTYLSLFLLPLLFKGLNKLTFSSVDS